MKKANLNEEYFVVIIPRGKVRERARHVQKMIARHFGLYQDGNYPELHITIDRIYKKYANQAAKVLQKMMLKSKEIMIELNEFTCYKQIDDRYLVMKVAETQSLVNFADDLHIRLKEKGISTIDDYRNWEYHITVLSNMFTDNPVSNLDFAELCTSLEGKEMNCESKVNRIEIWSPVSKQEDKCLYSFKFNERGYRSR